MHNLKKQGYNLDFKSLTVRLIKHKIGNKIYIYAAILLDNINFLTSCFAKIYHGRFWY